MSDDSKPSRTESISNAFNSRVKNLEAANELSREERKEAEKGFEHSETPLVEEQRFVGNPDELRKSVDSEEKFTEGLSDEADDEAKQAKKAAAKKS